MRLTVKQVTWLKVCLHLAGLLPFLWLVWAINHGGLGADPVKDIQHFTGRTALKFLLATLLITPLARYAKQPLLLCITLTRQPLSFLSSIHIAKLNLPPIS